MPVIAGAQRADHIDVLLVDLEGHPDWNAWNTVPGKVIGTWDGRRVPEVLDLLAALSGSESRRCFIPHYAVRLRLGPLVLTEVALCFQCHNAVSLRIDDTSQPRTWFTFDPDGAPAQDLLRLLRSCAG